MTNIVQFLAIYLTCMIPIAKPANTPFTDWNLCGRPTPDILAGAGTLETLNIPWNAIITGRHEYFPDKTFAGVLISPSLVMTTSSFFVQSGTKRFNIWPFKNYFVSFGSSSWGDPAHRNDTGVVNVKITHIRIHPNYKIGNWTLSQKNVALLHLQQPVPLSPRIHPICLPNLNDVSLITSLESPSPPLNQTFIDDLIVTGWNRNLQKNLVLRMEIQNYSKCLDLWENEPETKPAPYLNRFCAFVGENNKHTTCIHRDVAAVRYIDNSYYFSGIVNNFYSTNSSRICHPGALYYFNSFSSETHSWINDNVVCGSDNFTCTNGDCVSVDKICDTNPDCADKSDENPAYCRGLNFCTEMQFECGIYGKCIPNEKVHDGVSDCENGEDEVTEFNTTTVLIIVPSLVAILIGLTILTMWRRHVRILRRIIRNLTEEEIDQFFKGVTLYETLEKEMDKDLISFDTIYVNDPIQCMPWKPEYEIPFKHININREINRGNFGIVFKAILHNDLTVKKHINSGRVDNVYTNLRQPKQNGVEVAVKTHLNTVGVEEFKALLCELKILAYVGPHDNIVSFLGACTENIKKREVYLIVEFCPNGSLYDHLINNGKNFVDGLDTAKSSHDYKNANVDCFTALDLHKWSAQIANGMEYLASRNVVHGDLAARNVLLTDQMKVKISDFGLSRQLGGSGIYVKTTREPIPFKWLALESLQASTFSEKSDVWAFGVTMWEIFSLGEQPYRGKQWNHAFISELLIGHRLPKPEYAPHETFMLMWSCWEQKPELRPDFTLLKTSLARYI